MAAESIAETTTEQYNRDVVESAPKHFYKVLGVVAIDGTPLCTYRLGYTSDMETTKAYYRDMTGWETEISTTRPYIKFVRMYASVSGILH